MRKIISTVLAFAMLATSSVTFAGASEARNRGDRYERHHDDDRYRHRRNNDGDIAAAAIIGLALGAIIIGSQQNRHDRTYDNNYYRDDDRRDSNWEHIRRCERRYRSYDRYSDTFIGRDGRRYYCNL